MTPRQGQLLEFIRAYQAAHGGVSPSFDEMSVAIGLKSRGGVHRLVSALEQGGHIRCRAGIRRSIEIVETDPISVIRSAVAVLVERHGSAWAADQLSGMARDLRPEAA